MLAGDVSPAHVGVRQAVLLEGLPRRVLQVFERVRHGQVLAVVVVQVIDHGLQKPSFAEYAIGRLRLGNSQAGELPESSRNWRCGETKTGPAELTFG